MDQIISVCCELPPIPQHLCSHTCAHTPGPRHADSAWPSSLVLGFASEPHEQLMNGTPGPTAARMGTGEDSTGDNKDGMPIHPPPAIARAGQAQGGC